MKGKIGLIAGFIFSYFVFTTLLYYILKFAKKLPIEWTYIHIAVITLLIIALGFIVKKLLK